MDSWEGTVTHPEVTGALHAGPPMSPPERDCTAFQRQAATSPSGDAGIKGGPNDYERKTLCDEPKVYLGLSSETNSHPRDLAWPVTDKRLAAVIPMRGKLGGSRYRIEAATYCGGPGLNGAVANDIPFGKLESENCGGGEVRERVPGAKDFGWEGASTMGSRMRVVYLDVN